MIAVGHAILVMIYYMLDRHITYQKLGGNYFDEHERQSVEKLGYKVSLQPSHSSRLGATGCNPIF